MDDDSDEKMVDWLIGWLVGQSMGRGLGGRPRNPTIPTPIHPHLSLSLTPTSTHPHTHPPTHTPTHLPPHTQTPPHLPPPHTQTQAVYAMAFDKTGEYIASGALGGSLYVWSVKDGTIVRSFRKYESPSSLFPSSFGGILLLGAGRSTPRFFLPLLPQ
jgi:WD40 repeat protein